MTVNPRCNNAGPLGKPIPTRTVVSLFDTVFVRLGWLGRR